MKSIIFVFLIILGTTAFAQGFQPVAKSLCASSDDFKLDSQGRYQIAIDSAVIDYYSADDSEHEEEFLSLDRIEKRFGSGVYTLWFGDGEFYDDLKSHFKSLLEPSDSMVCLYFVEGLRGNEIYFEGAMTK